MSLLYLFDLSTEELVPCAMDCSQALLFWAPGSALIVSLCSTRSQPRDCRSLLNLLLLDATGFPAAFPLTRQRCVE